MRTKQLEIDLPEPPDAGAFHSSLSGDSEYEDAMEKWRRSVNAKIVESVPRGHVLSGTEICKVQTVRHFAKLTVTQD